MTDQIRDAVKELSPPWLQIGNGERYVYNFGLACDALLEKLNQGVQARMPGRGDPSALPLLASDRQLLQGLTESDASFAVRLSNAFTTWQHAGERATIMKQVLGYLSETTTLTGQLPQIAIVGGYDSQSWDTYYTTDNKTGSPSHVVATPQNFSWDGLGARWWRCWLVLYFAAQPVSPAQNGSAASVSSISGSAVTLTGLVNMTAANVNQFLTLSGCATLANNGQFSICSIVSPTSVVIGNPNGVAPDANNGALSWSVVHYPGIGPGPSIGSTGMVVGDPTRSLGTNTVTGVFRVVRTLLRQWKSASAFYPNIILCFGGADGRTGSEFSPNSGIGTGNPDGKWGRWGKDVNGQRVAARSTGVQLGMFDCFADGSGFFQQSFEQVIA